MAKNKVITINGTFSPRHVNESLTEEEFAEMFAKFVDENDLILQATVNGEKTERIELLEMRLNRINAKIDAENLRLYGPNAEPLPKKHTFKYTEATTVRPNRVFK